MPAVLDDHIAVPSLAHPHFAPRRRIVTALRFQLEIDAGRLMHVSASASPAGKCDLSLN
jgi:hypothetical protein